MSYPAKVRVYLNDGTAAAVTCFAHLPYMIDGVKFWFYVTQTTGTLGKSITDARSGRRVCALGVSAEHITALKKCLTDTARAEVCLQILVTRCGAPKVREVLQSAPTLGVRS